MALFVVVENSLSRDRRGGAIAFQNSTKTPRLRASAFSILKLLNRQLQLRLCGWSNIPFDIIPSGKRNHRGIVR